MLWTLASPGWAAAPNGDGQEVEEASALKVLASALAGLEALLANEPDSKVEERLSASHMEVLAALEVLDEPCRSDAVTRLGSAVVAMADVEGTAAVIQDLSAGGRLLVAESMEALERRVGDRDPRSDEAIAAFAVANQESEAVARLDLLASAEQSACTIFDEGPRLLLLSRDPAKMATHSYYSLRQLADTPMPAALDQAGATLVGTREGHAIALDHRLGIAVVVDPKLSEAASATVFGAARLLARGEDAKRYAVADLKAGAVRVFDPSDGEIEPLPFAAPPIALALSPDGSTVALATSEGEVVVQKPGQEGASLELDDPYVWSLAFGASTEEVFVVTSAAVVQRVAASDGVLATSGVLPGLRECQYLAGLERLGVSVIKDGNAVVMLLRGEDLSVVETVDLGGLIDQADALIAVGGRDLVLSSGETTVIVDGSTGSVIETIDHPTSITLGVAPGR